MCAAHALTELLQIHLRKCPDPPERKVVYTLQPSRAPSQESQRGPLKYNEIRHTVNIDMHAHTRPCCPKKKVVNAMYVNVGHVHHSVEREKQNIYRSTGGTGTQTSAVEGLTVSMVSKQK